VIVTIETIGKGRAQQGERRSRNTTLRHSLFAFNFAGRLAESIANKKPIVIDENLPCYFGQSCETTSPAQG
jgi:hypothetical protein